MKLTLKNTFQNLRQDVAYAKDRLAVATAAKNQIAVDLKIANEILDSFECSAHMYVCGVTASITCSITVTSFKEDETLLAMLSKADDLAFATASNDTVASWIVERAYRFSLPNGGFFTIEARLNEEEAQNCRKVQTGTKLVEEPIYAIVCD